MWTRNGYSWWKVYPGKGYGRVDWAHGYNWYAYLGSSPTVIELHSFASGKVSTLDRAKRAADEFMDLIDPEVPNGS